MSSTDVDTGPPVEVTTEPKLSALPPALVAEPTDNSTVIMSEKELQASLGQLQDETHFAQPAPIAARSWHRGLAPELQAEDQAEFEGAQSTFTSSKGLLVLGLIAIIAFSLYALPAADPEIDGGLPGNDSANRIQEPQAATPTPAEPTIKSLPPLLDKGTHVRAFLKTTVGRVIFDSKKDTEARLESATVGAAISGQKITIVNIWATWCEPCKDEMPGLKQVFELSGWGHEVHFVPIQADDESRQKAYAEFAPIMPEHSHYLAGTEVLKSLAADDAVAEDAELPITLLLDCRRQLRWARVGELNDQNIRALEGLVDKLRAELSERYCRPKKTKIPKSQGENPERLEPQKPRKKKPTCGTQSCSDGDICNLTFDPPRCTAKIATLRDD